MATSIFPALQIQPPASPIQQIAGVEQIADMQQRRQLGAVQLQQEQMAATSQQTLMQIYAANKGDMNKTLSDAIDSGQVLPEHINAFRNSALAAQIQASQLTKDQLENHAKLAEMAANELDSIKNLPPDQMTQGIKDSVGRIIQAGGPDTARWLLPVAQDLLNNPTPDNFQRKETLLMGERWLNQNAQERLKLASTPTAEQAQAKNAAELSKAQTEALTAQREYDSMPSVMEASSIRARQALLQQSEIAKNNAETANAKLDAKMKGVKLVYAVDAQGQMNLLPVDAANAAAMKVYMEAPSDAYANEKKSAIEIGSVQSGMSEYRAAANDPRLRSDAAQDSAMAAILSNNKLLGELADKIPLGARMNDIATATQNAEHWNELDPQHQRLVASYLTAKIGAMNMQKLQGGSIGRNQEVIHAEFAAVPSPLEAGSPSFNEQVDQFQKRLNVASQGYVKVPGVRGPQDIRNDIESRAAQDAARDAAAQQVFQQNRVNQPAAQLFRPPISTGTPQQ